MPGPNASTSSVEFNRDYESEEIAELGLVLNSEAGTSGCPVYNLHGDVYHGINMGGGRVKFTSHNPIVDRLHR